MPPSLLAEHLIQLFNLKTLELSLEVCKRSTRVLPLLGLNYLSLAKTDVARPSSSFALFMSNGVNIGLSPGTFLNITWYVI